MANGENVTTPPSGEGSFGPAPTAGTPLPPSAPPPPPPGGVPPSYTAGYPYGPPPGGIPYQPAPPPARRPLTLARSTAALVALLVLVVGVGAGIGIGAGIWAGRRPVVPSFISPTGPRRFAPTAPRTFPAYGFGRFGASGKITGVSATTVTLKEPNGTSVTVDVPSSATITVTTTGSKSDLTSGACVRVLGSPTSPSTASSSITARTVEVLPSSDCSSS